MIDNNYERAVNLAILAMNKFPSDKRVLHAAYFLLGIRVKGTHISFRNNSYNTVY